MRAGKELMASHATRFLLVPKEALTPLAGVWNVAHASAFSLVSHVLTCQWANTSWIEVAR